MSPLGVLLFVGVALVLVAALTADRPARVLALDEHLAGWSAGHGGLPSTGVVGGYLRVVHALARPLARGGVAPDVVTLTGVWLSAVVLALPDPLPVLAGVLVVAAALLDGVDGALAVLTDRSTARGAVLDRVCDRVTEVLWLAAAVVAGCPWWLAVACGVAIAALEGVRRGRPVRVTVAEKPTRVIVLAPALALAPLDLTGLGVGLLLALTVAGLVQLRGR